jgi:hypothetical protein
MVSRENAVIVACIGITLGTLYALVEVVGLSSVAFTAGLLFGGVVAPLAINGYLDRRGAGP